MLKVAIKTTPYLSFDFEPIWQSKFQNIFHTLFLKNTEEEVYLQCFQKFGNTNVW